VPSGHY